MTMAKFLYSVLLFVSGLGVGVLWSPLGASSPIPQEHQDRYYSRAVSDAQFQNRMAEVRKEFGKEMEDFVRQFKDMTIRIKKYPIDAWASPDGRFVIRLFGNDETIASDLRYPDKGGAVKELVRHYSFSCGKQTYSCDVGRNIENSKTTNVLFHFTDAKGGQLAYVDLDGDGRWDRFTDYTQEPSNIYTNTYVREGLCWKRIAKDASKK